ncbi:MAG: undecaprenyl-diphosphatase, partial [Gemmatimonadota bacterium]|nr:undecaprenyl-diphosphatase [Gemmatimonadota bacterium]
MNAQATDVRLFETINGLAGRWSAADALMLFVAKYSPIVIAIILVILWIRWRRDAQRASGLAATAALIALGLG